MAIKKFLNIAKNDMFHLCRSITGRGTFKTLKIIKKNFPKLKIKSVKSKTKAFDWVVPDEWIIQDAFIIDKYKNKIINFKNNNLHVMGYSAPINKVLTKKDILKKIYISKKQPNGIPYITSYYKKNWGFCSTAQEKKNILKNYQSSDKFKVFINSKFKKGKLHYGEIVLPGKSKKEILISTYICHPSMANNELSGPIVSMSLINYFQKQNLKKTIRFLFIPETIGSIVYLSKNLKKLKKNVIGGYNLSCIGDDRMHSCILTKNENSCSDKALLNAYKRLKIKPKIFSFLKRGSDERQYNSPMIDLNIATICRSKFGEYPEYHTSMDNFNIVSEKGLFGGFKVVRSAIKYLINGTYPISKIYCEPFLSKINFYQTISGTKKNKYSQKILDFLQYSDGKNEIKEIQKKIKLNKKVFFKVYKILLNKNLITS